MYLTTNLTMQAHSAETQASCQHPTHMQRQTLGSCQAQLSPSFGLASPASTNEPSCSVDQERLSQRISDSIRMTSITLCWHVVNVQCDQLNNLYAKETSKEDHNLRGRPTYGFGRATVSPKLL